MFMNLRPKKSLGQNFLKDENSLEKIAKAGFLDSRDNVLEIGPGQGALTEKLLQKAGRVLAVEKDEELADFVENKFEKEVKEGRLVVKKGDILELNLPQVLEENNFGDYKLAANIPYYITGKILRLFLETEISPKKMVFLVQKEVAERVCAKEGKKNLLAVIVSYFAEAEIAGIVKKEHFTPEPKVDSAILKINPREKHLYGNEKEEKEFFRLVKIGFSAPRKTLANNLSGGLGLNKQEVGEKLEKAGIPIESRAQNLSVEDWQILCRIFKNK